MIPRTLSNISISMSDMFKAILPVAIILGSGIAAWVNINITLTKHTDELHQVMDQHIDLGSKLDVLQGRQTNLEYNQDKIMFKLHIPIDNPVQRYYDWPIQYPSPDAYLGGRNTPLPPLMAGRTLVTQATHQIGGH